MDDIKEKSRQLEALLFLASQPLTEKNIVKKLNLNHQDFVTIYRSLKERLELSSLDVLHINDTYEFSVKPEYSKLLSSVFNNLEDRQLSPASLEVLSIILFRGPISKINIEDLRGIHSGQTLRRLTILGLIDIKNKKDVQKNEISPIYDVTSKFIKHIGFTSKNECLEWIKQKNNNAKKQNPT